MLSGRLGQSRRSCPPIAATLVCFLLFGIGPVHSTTTGKGVQTTTISKLNEHTHNTYTTHTQHIHNTYTTQCHHKIPTQKPTHPHTTIHHKLHRVLTWCCPSMYRLLAQVRPLAAEWHPFIFRSTIAFRLSFVCHSSGTWSASPMDLEREQKEEREQRENRENR